MSHRENPFEDQASPEKESVSKLFAKKVIADIDERFHPGMYQEVLDAIRTEMIVGIGSKLTDLQYVVKQLEELMTKLSSDVD